MIRQTLNFSLALAAAMFLGPILLEVPATPLRNEVKTITWGSYLRQISKILQSIS